MRKNNGREAAQPEWPEAASETSEVPVAGEGTQAFPETRGTEVLASAGKAEESEESEALPEAGPEGPALSDPWENAHDPHEVTVQLDAVALGSDNRLTGQAGGSAPEGSDGPVFVDESGRRSRRYRRIGILAGIACAIYAVVIVATLLSGNSNASWLPVPGRGEDKEAGQVENSPLPADPAEPTGADGVLPGVSPGVSPSLSGGTTPSPGASATAPGASASASAPGPSADPEPTATATTPGTGSDPSADPEESSPPSSVTPDPTTPTAGPSTTPADPPAGGSAGTGTGTETVADGASSPVPVDSTAPPADSTAPSPEYIL